MVGSGQTRFFVYKIRVRSGWVGFQVKNQPMLNPFFCRVESFAPSPAHGLFELGRVGFFSGESSRVARDQV